MSTFRNIFAAVVMVLFVGLAMTPSLAMAEEEDGIIASGDNRYGAWGDESSLNSQQYVIDLCINPQAQHDRNCGKGNWFPDFLEGAD